MGQTTPETAEVDAVASVATLPPTVAQVAAKVMSGVEADTIAVLNLHRPTDEHTDHDTPMCSCGHDLGMTQTWGEHVTQVLATEHLLRVQGRVYTEYGVLTPNDGVIYGGVGETPPVWVRLGPDEVLVNRQRRHVTDTVTPWVRPSA